MKRFLTHRQRLFLEEMAKRYLWWKSVDEAMDFPAMILTQVMDIGVTEDVFRLEHTFDRETLVDTLIHAEPGKLRPRSWSFWHYRLGLAESEHDIPEPPVRRIP